MDDIFNGVYGWCTYFNCWCADAEEIHGGYHDNCDFNCDDCPQQEFITREDDK